MLDRFVDGEGANSIAVRDFGGDGEPILFVHGFGHDQHVWDDVVADLGIPARVLTMDLRGHGRSSWSIEGDYGLEAYAADLLRVVDGLGLERVALVAHSMGGNVATLFAAGAPERVSRFVLVDTGPSLSSAGMMQAAQGVAGTLRSYPSVAAYRETLEGTYPLAGAVALDRLARTSAIRRRDGRFELRLDPGALGGTVAPELVDRLEESLWQALSEIVCPTLVVRGGASATLREEVAERMVRAGLRDGRLETIEGAGHSLMLDAPDRFRDALERFFSTDAHPERRQAVWVGDKGSDAMTLVPGRPA